MISVSYLLRVSISISDKNEFRKFKHMSFLGSNHQHWFSYKFSIRPQSSKQFQSLSRKSVCYARELESIDVTNSNH